MLKRFKSDGNVIYQIIREIRLRQWIKNGFVFGPLVLGNKLFEVDPLFNSVLAFFVFSFAASFVYIINDVVDIEKDKRHPIKSNRPLASGKLKIGTALKASIILLSASLLLSLQVNEFLFFLALGYVLLQLSYSFYLKNLIIIDALIVSLGFIIRVFAGGVASAVSISSWLILSVIGLSLLLAFGKRRAERTILSSKKLDLNTRDTLKNYPDTLLDSMISMSAAYTIISYSLFAFQTSPDRAAPALFEDFLPYTLSSPKWMMLSIPLIIYAVARYLYVIYESKNAESPERALLQDKFLLGSVAIWGLMIMFFYYVLGTVNI